ncbi:MAG: XRE family transcriptional regulator [Actinomycetota bacterium]|nr:XRE family transcriptional regulator [Actinomycetota bacterium]
MDSKTTALALAIGSRVRSERQNKGWTLDQLSRAAGVSRRMVINVEQGTTNPSVGVILRLSDALGVGLPSLVEPPSQSLITVTRAGEGATLWRGDRGGRGVLLVGTRAPTIIELWDWVLEPGESHKSEAHSSGTFELLQVIEGELSVNIGSEQFHLAIGDAISFGGDEPHSYENSGQDRCRFSLCVFDPGAESAD